MTICLYRLCLLLALISLSACATVSKGTHERVRFETTPPGARVVTEVETPASQSSRKRNPEKAKEFYSCEPTPCEIKLSRRINTIATLTYPDMEPLEFAITSGASARNLAPNVTGSAATGVAVGSLGVAIGTGFGASAATSLAVIAGPAAILAVGVGGSMALVDLASGAGLQLSPNPLIVTMVPKGTEVIPDPVVAQLRTSPNFKGVSAQRVYNILPAFCSTKGRLSDKREAQCLEARRQIVERERLENMTDAKEKPAS